MKEYGVAVFIMLMLILPFQVNADSGEYIIKLKDDFLTEQYKSELKEVNAERRIYVTNSDTLLSEISEYIEAVAPNEEVELIEDVETISLLNAPEDEMYSQMWHMDMINAASAWNLETYGNEIKVAVIDSGCYAHDDLKNNLLPGKNYCDGTEDVSDNNGHGTHVSGIIAAEMNGIGVVGVAPKAKIVPLKCFNTSTTYMNILISAIYDAVDVYDCKIINMSWGMPSGDEFLKEAIEYAYDKGVILVAAVGNDKSSKLYYPAAYECVIGVGSIDKTKVKSSFSQYNESVFVVAPGSDILSTYNDGGYKTMRGTSQATPMVSGLAAILLSADFEKTANDFKQLLASTSEDLGDEGYDVNFGYGLINIDLFMKKALQNTSVYISPVCKKDDVSGVYYFNLTDEECGLMCIKTYFGNGEINRCVSENISLLGKESFFYEYDDENVKYMAWENLNSLMPLGKSRIIGAYSR